MQLLPEYSRWISKRNLKSHFEQKLLNSSSLLKTSRSPGPSPTQRNGLKIQSSKQSKKKKKKSRSHPAFLPFLFFAAQTTNRSDRLNLQHISHPTPFSPPAQPPFHSAAITSGQHCAVASWLLSTLPCLHQLQTALIKTEKHSRGWNPYLL